MKTRTALVMTGIGFTFGMIFGLVIHLPVISLPAASFSSRYGEHARSRRQVLQTDPDYIADIYDPKSALLPAGAATKSLQSDLDSNYAKLFPVENYLDNGPQVGNADKSSHLSPINQIPNKSSNSLVYVNSVKKKLVYNNNLTDPNTLEVQLRTENEIVQEKREDKEGENDANKIHPALQSFWPIKDIYWSPELERGCTEGFSSSSHDLWQKKSSQEKVLKMDEGCGRMQNRFLTFQDTTKACARYRLNIDQIQGEIFSYYLSKLLGLSNVPPSALNIVDVRTDQWRMVQQSVVNAQWAEEKPVILARWVHGLEPAYIPLEFREDSRNLNPNTYSITGKSKLEMCELVQWSDLIVFDYLTGNLDRVVNNMFNKQWNSQIMHRPAHNLEKTQDGHLVFLDNESGLFHGYRLLDKYAPYHQNLLESLCVFRNSTVNAVRRLVQADSVGEELHKVFEASEPLHSHVPKVPRKNIKILQQRLKDVLNQIDKCELRYVR